MRSGFVGFSQQPLSTDSLVQLLEKFSSQPSYYFLRWSHAVSGFWQRRSKQFPDITEDIRDYLSANCINATFPSPEGQMFNTQLELRWKQKGSSYEVLLLSASDSESDHQGFQLVEAEWQVEEFPAYLYGSGETATETRFPKKFHHHNLKVAQRYFRDAKTATVHFVALTVGK